MTDRAPTIFERIIAGEIPCHRLYEDDHVLAFLDVNPISCGHALIVPKEPAAQLHELSEDAAAAVGRVLPRICRAVTEAVGAESYNVLQNNGAAASQSVMHVHFHVIPRHADDTGLGIGWRPTPLDDDGATRLVQAITARLA